MDASARSLLTPRRLALGALILGVAATSGALVTAYLQREAIGVRLALDFLRAHGVPADIRLDRLDLQGASGALRLGPWWRPDLTVPHLEMRFRALPASAKGLGPPQVRSLELDQPTLHGRWADGRLQFGTLQPLIDQAMRAKPNGQAPPDLYIRDGRLLLDTPQGRLVVALDAALEGGRLHSAHVRLEPVDLSLWGVRLAAVQGVLSAQPVGPGRLHLTAAFGAERGHGKGAAATGLSLSAEALAPDDAASASASAAQARPLDASLHLQIGRVALQPARAAPVRVRDADVTLDLDGMLDARNSFAGRLRANGRAAELAQGGLDVAALKLALASSAAQADLRGGRPPGEDTGDGLTASGPFVLSLTAAGGRAATSAGEVALGPARLTAQGRLDVAHGVRVAAQGAVQGSGGLAPAAAERWGRRTTGGADPGAAAALATALRQVRLAATAYSASYDDRSGGALRLPGGAALQLANGALALQPLGAAAVARSAGPHAVAGAAALTVRVAGLPQVALSAPAYRFGPDGAQVRGTLAARGGFGPLQDADLRFDGELTGRNGAWTVRAAQCAELRAGLLRAGGAPVRDVAGRLCPDVAAPLASFGPLGWRGRGRVEAASFTLPQAQLRGALRAADLDLAGGRQPLSGQVSVQGLALQDLAPTPRLRPLRVQGGLGFGGGAAEGRFDLALADGGAPLGGLTLRTRFADGTGAAVFDSGAIRLDRKGLQAGDIVPALAHALPDAEGAVRVAARLDWTRAGLASSSGEVSSEGLSFRTPAGRIDGLHGAVRLVSLLPLQSAANQSLAADRLETLLPLTELKAAVTLGPQAIALQGASAELAGGQVALDPMRLPLGGAAETAGVLRLKGVQLDKVIGAFNLANAVTLDARVDGELPFAVRAGAPGAAPQVRISQGRIAAEGPGRLTIQRQALGAAVATAGAAGAQPNAVQDFAYQALENLAFTRLDAAVSSRPQGRLGVVFHVVGQHDPKIDKPTRIGLFALLRGHAFDKPLPLPKGTPVDLTLDSSLNLDELLASYAALDSASGSGAVKP